MEPSSALLALCAGNSTVTGEFPAQRPVARSFDVFFDLRLSKRLSKKSWVWWFETPLCPLWSHCNVLYTPTLIIWFTNTQLMEPILFPTITFSFLLGHNVTVSSFQQSLVNWSCFWHYQVTNYHPPEGIRVVQRLNCHNRHYLIMRMFENFNACIFCFDLFVIVSSWPPHKFNPAWICTYIHYKMWDEITNPFLNFNGATVKV